MGLEFSHAQGAAEVGGGAGEGGESERAAAGFGGVTGECAGPGDVAMAQGLSGGPKTSWRMVWLPVSAI